LLQYFISSPCISYNKTFYLKLNMLAKILLTHFTLVFMGLLAFSLVLGGWETEQFIKHHSPIPCSTLDPEVLKDFSNKNKFLKWHSRIAQSVWFLTKAFVCLLSPTSKKAFVELMVERKIRHTWFKCFAKPKIEPNRVNKSYNYDREVHMCGWVVDGMDK